MKSSKLAHPVFLGLSVTALFFAAGVAKGETIPFKASIAISESVHPPTTVACFLQGDVSGKGAAPRLGGSISLTSTDCIFPMNADLTEFAANASNGVLTTPLGTLNVTYAVSLVLVSGVGKLEGGFLITGGTGSFTGYCGFGNLTGVEAVKLNTATGVGTGQGQVTLSGVIHNNACPASP